MRTTVLKAIDGRKKQWVVLDAEGQILGRLATRIAMLLRGKHLPAFTPHVHHGNTVIVINASKVKVTGKKLTDKFDKRYSGYPGGLKLIPWGEVLAKRPDRLVRRAVWGMLPHGRLGRRQIRALKIYSGASHPHVAQQPVAATGAAS